jgi:hypothetical protein
MNEKERFEILKSQVVDELIRDYSNKYGALYQSDLTPTLRWVIDQLAEIRALFEMRHEL